MTASPLGSWLFVDASPFFGGHEVMLLRWIDELQAQAQVRPRVLARASSRLLDQAPQATRCEPFPAEGGLRAELQWLRRSVRALEPECVVVASGALGAHVPHVMMLRAMGLRVLLYVPLLGAFASMGYRLGAWKDRFVRWFYAKVPSGWVAITEAQADEFRAWARPSGPVFVLPNTIAPELEQAARMPVRARGPQEPLRALVLGRLDAHQKGLDLLLDHLAQSDPARYGGLHFSLVGDGPYHGDIEATVRTHPALAQHVQLQPWMSAHAALADCDVLLLCSRYEGVPLVMLEAMALGVPVVCSDLPGTQPYVPAGCRFAVGDIAAALAALQTLRPVERRRQLADAGRAGFEAQASGRAFSAHVQQLTRSVRARFNIPGAAAAMSEAPGIAGFQATRELSMLVTVYIPTKNRLALLQRAVASVLAQTHQDLEVIVADDGSTDGTLAWLEQLSTQDGRIRFFHHAQSLGAPAARNKAIRSARGEWVTGLDDDDSFMPERLALFLEHAARLDASGQRYSGLYATEVIESEKRSYTLDKPAVTEFGDLFRYNTIGNQIFARRQAYLDAGLFDESMPAWQDLDLFLRMVHKCGPAHLVPQATYRLADDDRSDRISKKKKPKLIDAYARICAKWPDAPATDKQRLYLQLLAPFYGFPLEWADVRRYFGQGVSLSAAVALFKNVVKRAQRHGRAAAA
ncbi:glycosyltransferase [Pseudorhodoferax soli]|uniref:Glycosyl transferase family 1 n=1 Tax=Pseudorhodoferax soli TaxID=545864 RepID=A0A368Y6Y2_9BURK|nr:glycosyltransferase [Pseudorhodoferax soli]RCW76040.1 glycosyl transferase family 1 [Pseudorhodoferax soli]